jgi:predicted RNA-binding Zn-ribbon protein involved in translation (DUF1610 family)
MPLTTKELIMDKDRQEEVISTLKEKGATLPCPRCRNLEFEVIGESMIPIYPEGGEFMVGRLRRSRDGVPTVLVSCTNCGYIAQHAKRLLDLKR